VIYQSSIRDYLCENFLALNAEILEPEWLLSV
jgi:hypothetical protein